MVIRWLLAGTVLAFSVSGLSAQSTTKTYKYDAQGRLVEVSKTGGSENNQRVRYCYDKAGNRTAVKAKADGTLPACPNP